MAQPNTVGKGYPNTISRSNGETGRVVPCLLTILMNISMHITDCILLRYVKEVYCIHPTGIDAD